MKYSATVSSSRRKSRKVRVARAPHTEVQSTASAFRALMVMDLDLAGSFHGSIEREEKADERSPQFRAQEQVWGMVYKLIRLWAL